jgi:uncharacterized protein
MSSRYALPHRWRKSFWPGDSSCASSQSFLGPLGAVVLSAAAWAAAHTQYNWFYMSEIFALGILFGMLRLRTGSTWLTVFLHAVNNAVAVVVVAVAIG